MKNLKKVLALGLALVMILGMFTIASAAEIKTASDFTDWDKVEHKDAVALCVDLGIINGLPDGSFNPEGNLDRASWAKLVYFTATGDDNADAYLGVDNGLKDTAGNWAESYINYLFAMNYVSGDGTGNYMPNGTVTVAAGLKTMLTVLGWDADDRGYQGTSAWAGNVITDAKRNGLMDEIDRKNTSNVNLTRDNAAQIVYNALMAQTVEVEKGRDNGEKYVTKHNPTGVTLLEDVFDVIPVTATVKTVTDGVATFEGSDPSCDGALNNAKVKASAANIGTKVTVFVHTNKKDVVSTVVASAGATADKTFTGGVTIADIWTDSKDDYVGEKAEGFKSYVDGDPDASLGASYVGGNVVEVYTTDGKVSMIKVTTYTPYTVDGDVETRTYGDKEQVKVPGVNGLTSFKNVDVVDGWQGLADGDVVLKNVSKGVIYLEKAEKVTGKVTRKSDSKLTINGTQYAQSGIATENVDFANWKVSDWKDNEYDFYLDKNGDVCEVVQISGETATEVAYVLGAGRFSTSATGLANSGTATVEAELLFTDGTHQIVTVAKIGSTDADDMTDNTQAKAIVGAMVDYSVNSKGKYELKAKGTAVAKIENAEVSAAPVFAEGQTLKADNATVFLIAKGNDNDGYEYSVVTGYKNVPAMSAKAVVAVTDGEGGIVTYAYLETEQFKGEGSDGLIYVKDPAAYDEDTSGNKIYKIVDAEGNETTLALECEEALATGFYVIKSTDDNGVATVAATEIADETSITVGKGIVTVGSTTYATDSSTVAVVIDTDTDGFVSSSGVAIGNFKTETGYTYKVKVVNDGDNADYIYIVRHNDGSDAE